MAKVNISTLPSGQLKLVVDGCRVNSTLTRVMTDFAVGSEPVLFVEYELAKPEVNVEVDSQHIIVSPSPEAGG